MSEENTNSMNLDLNLGPVDNSSDDNDPTSGSYPDVPITLEDWLDGPLHRVSEVVRQTNQRWRSLWRQVPIPHETRDLALELIVGNSPHTGEGSVVHEQSPVEVPKLCENGNGPIEEDGLGKKKENGTINGDELSFFDCNICLHLSKDPVVTCCGHLFCWPCLYQWLHHHSDANECPVCKGEVTTKNVTPIYGRGSNSTRDPHLDSSVKIPLRPQAHRVESWRQAIQRNAFTIPLDEMIRHLRGPFELPRELAQVQNGGGGPHESPERNNNSLLNRFLSSRARRGVRAPSDHVIDLTESNRVERNDRELGPQVDDRDSVSSIAAVIHSESQTVDNAIEIDSTVSLSTLSSRRRNDTSRISDVDSGDSRAPRRRRRLN